MSREIKLSEEIINAKGLIEENEENNTEVMLKDFNKAVFQIVDYLTQNKIKMINEIRDGQIKTELLDLEIEEYIDTKTVSVKGYDRKGLIKGVRDWLFYYWTYQDLLDDPLTTEMKIVSRNLTIINKINNMGIPQSPIFDETERFDSDTAYISFCKYVARRNRKELNKINSVLVFIDKKTCKGSILRINITSEFINSKGVPLIVIAKTPREKKSLDDLRNLRMFNDVIQEYIEVGTAAGLKMVVGGAGGAGKTNLMNAAIEKIPDDIPTLVLQRDPELHSKKKNLFFQELLEDVVEESMKFGLRRLSINAMKMRIKKFVLGELEGAETFDFFNAAYSGHSVMASIHIDRPQEFDTKAMQYIQYAGMNLSEETLLSMLASIDSVIFMQDFKVNEIAEIEGYDFKTKKIIYRTLFKYDSEADTWVKENGSCNKVIEKIEYYKNRRLGGTYGNRNYDLKSSFSG